MIMAHGLQFFNDDGDLLVDSDLSHYHFAGKASHYNSTRVPDIVGGEINGPHVNTNGQTISSGQVTGDIFKFKLYVGATTNAPMCFIKPRTSSTALPFAGIVLMKSESDSGGSYWDIWVLQDRDFSRPSLYCFLPISDMTTNQSTPATGETQGVAAYDTSGTRTYDSRLLPLKIIGNTSANAPSIARTGTIANGYSPNFEPDQTLDFTFSTSTDETDVDDLMYYCPSFAHACQDTSVETSGEGFQAQGYNSYFYAWGRGDLFWTFYRATYRLTSATNFQSSYTEYAVGHVWDSDENSEGILGALVGLVFAVFTFGASLWVALGGLAGGALLTAAMTNAGVGDGIYYPYENDSRNAGQFNPVILSKASYYAQEDQT